MPHAAALTEDDRRIDRLASRVRRLPDRLERARRNVAHLEAEMRRVGLPV